MNLEVTVSRKELKVYLSSFFHSPLCLRNVAKYVMAKKRSWLRAWVMTPKCASWVVSKVHSLQWKVIRNSCILSILLQSRGMHQTQSLIYLLQSSDRIGRIKQMRSVWKVFLYGLYHGSQSNNYIERNTKGPFVFISILYLVIWKALWMV